MIISCIIVITLIILTILYVTIRTRTSKAELSFRDSLYLTGLPLVIVQEKDLGNLNLLIDSGSNHSIISKDLIETKTDIPIKVRSSETLTSIGGTTDSYGSIDLALFYQDLTILHKFQVFNLEALNNLKKEYGVTVHGIIGSDFFSKYSSIIDYNRNVIYNNK